MWALASQISDHDLVNFTIKVSATPEVLGTRAHLSKDDLVVVRSAVTSYGPIILGKIRIRAIKLDSAGQLVPGEVEKDAQGKIKVEMKHGKIDDDNLGFIFVRYLPVSR